MSRLRSILLTGFGAMMMTSVACDAPAPDVDPFEGADAELRAANRPPVRNVGSYNLHLQPGAEFEPVIAGTSAEQGRARFGVAPDLVTEDATEALFEGDSATAGGLITSNGRSCFTCHRGIEHDFGMPPPPLSDTISLDDPLFTGIDADAQGDPDAMENLDGWGLFKIRPNRFNPTRDADDPFVQVFGWRKSPALVNIGFAHGLLTDLRGRTMFETARGAVFSHTQESDQRFDDLFSQQDGDDIAAFLFEQFSDPSLAPLRNPDDPMYQALVDDPFATVPVVTRAERKGLKIFKKKCMACHETPNVFNDSAYVEALGHGARPTSFPTWAPAIGRGYNIGISEANRHDLRFTNVLPGGEEEVIVLPLAKEDGTTCNYPVQIDVGLAATTGRYEDVGRFKVPALRNLSRHAPYFHDNSADTLEEVVDYFCSPEYNDSQDGQLYPIHLNASQRANLVAFLELL